MYLRSVELRDWRSYRHVRFELPRPHGKKNVVLIMAPNEHGKTSFFEAITLGLFGREGLPLVPRARAASGSNATEKLNTTYSQFLSATLHSRAIEANRPSCSVKIEMEDEDGEPVELMRKWHFRQDGVHKLYDDQLTIFEGVARTPVSPPASVEDRDGYFRDYIAQRFLRPSLAEFFLFDGEQVQRYADRGMSAQVRSGIEGLLGLPVLRSLKDSLERYAQARRSSAAGPSDAVVLGVEAEIAALEEQIEQNRVQIEAAETLIPSLDNEADDLTQRLGGRAGGGGTVALVAELATEEAGHRTEAAKSSDALAKLLGEDVALGVAGAELRRDTKERLHAEAKRERWEIGRNEGNQKLDQFTSELASRVSDLQLPIEDSDQAAVIDAAKEAWKVLWHPAPEGCADDYLHGALMGAARTRAIERLEIIDRRSANEVADLVARFNHAVESAEAKKRERLELEQTAPEAEKLSKRLQKVSEELGQLKAQKNEAENAKSADEGRLSSKRQELARYMHSKDKGAPALRRADRADQFAKLIEKLLDEAVPSEVGEVAKEMTIAWKAMAHMADRVERIDISPECEVRMLNADGEDLHRIDKSAGASQVFTQALIRAITKVSGQTFPFIVDTPLARLSRKQRLGVLKTFTDRPGQVILLSTDEEVVDDKLDAIRDRICASYELKITTDRGVSVTTVHALDTAGL